MFAHLWLSSQEKSLKVNLQSWNHVHCLSFEYTCKFLSRIFMLICMVPATLGHALFEHLTSLLNTVPFSLLSAVTSCYIHVHPHLGRHRPATCPHPHSKDDISDEAQSALLMKLDSPANPFSSQIGGSRSLWGCVCAEDTATSPPGPGPPLALRTRTVTTPAKGVHGVWLDRAWTGCPPPASEHPPPGSSPPLHPTPRPSCEFRCLTAVPTAHPTSGCWAGLEPRLRLCLLRHHTCTEQSPLPVHVRQYAGLAA